MIPSLTPEQLTELKAQLLALRAEFSQDVQEELEETRAQPYKKLAGEVHDKGDEAIAEQAAGMEAELAERRTEELHAAEAALRRMEDGEYGICIDCGGEIGYKRLKAYPMTRRCIACKTKFEGEHRGFETPSL